MSENAAHAILGVFETPEALQAAARRLLGFGYRTLEAYTPFPVEGLDDLLHARRRRGLPLLIALGAFVGAAWGYFIQYWDEVIDYPLNVGGRPHHSWPAFIVGAFEITLLFAVAAAFFGLLLWCGLPRLYHPIFSAAAFERASRDRFLLAVDPRDPRFELPVVEETLRGCGAEQVIEVAA